jgi:hypothetical protein
MMKRWTLALILPLVFLLPACGASPEPDIAAVEESVPPATATVVVNTPTRQPTPVVVEPTVPQQNEAAQLDPVETAAEVVEPATQTPEPTEAVVVPTEPAEAPTTEPAPPVQAEVDWLTVEGKTADNLAFLGNPDAPVTMIDYSDFL